MTTIWQQFVLIGAVACALAGHVAVAQGTRGIQVSGGNVFVLPANASNNEGATSNPLTFTEGNVTVTFSNYWTTWSDTDGAANGDWYGDIDAVMAVGPFAPGVITFTADPGYLVTVASVDLVGTAGNGSNNIPSLTIGSFSGSNLSFNSPTHNTLALNQTGSSLTLTYANPTFDYGWEGLNNIRFSQQAVAAAAPEPASLACWTTIAMAIAGAFWLRRRRQR